MPQYLAHEERIALGLVMKQADESIALAIEIVPGRDRDELLDLLEVETVQHDPLRLTTTAKVGEHLGERMRATEIRLSIGPEYEQR